MSAILYGVPGKLKTLIERLSSARAAKIDNLDATVSSRAAASTALSNVVWTDERAEALDDLVHEWDPILSPPIGLVPSDPDKSDAEGTTDFMLKKVSGLEKGSTSSTSFVDIVNYDGGGVLEFCALVAFRSDISYLRLIVDGNTLADISLEAPSGTYYVVKAVAGLYLKANAAGSIALTQIPFRESLVIQAKAHSISEVADVYYRYRKAYNL